jgi:hypothetical protein
VRPNCSNFAISNRWNSSVLVGEDDAGAGAADDGVREIREKVFLETIRMKFVTGRSKPQPHKSRSSRRSVRG